MLLCVFLPFFLILPAVVLPAVVDLVRQPEQVPLWWGSPLVLLLPFVPFVLGVPFALDPGMDRVLYSAVGWGLLHWAVAGILLGLVMGLAFSRGLRPGGETLRRRRTTLGGVVVLLLSMVFPWIPGLWGLMWVIPAAWAGLLFLIAFNRRGPQRFERGKAMAASFLFGSALSFLIGSAHFVGAMSLGVDLLELSWYVWLGPVAVLGCLTGGLRWLAGSPAPGPLLAIAASGLSLLFPIGWRLWFNPIPVEIKAPEWVDLMGQQGPPLPAYSTHNCLPITRADGSQFTAGGGCPDSWNEASLVDARTSLDRIPLDSVALLVDGGRRRLPQRGRYGTMVYLREVDGQARLFDIGAEADVWSVPISEPLPVGPELGEAIARVVGDQRPLMIERSVRWTVQDYVSMCASMPSRPSCSLSD